MIIAGPGLMAAAIVATGVAQVVSHGLFFVFQLAGTFLFINGLVTRMRADPVFAPSRLQDLEGEQPERPDDGIGYDEG